MIYRLGLPILVSMAQLWAAVLAIGRPDFASSVAFMAGGWPTAAGVLSALQLLVWAIVLGGVGWSIGSVAWELLNRPVVSPRWLEGSVLAVGLLILAAGAVHHFTYQVGMSGGTVEEAQRVIGR